MNANTIIRAWKDEEYRRSLSAEQLEALPANPAGLVEVAEEDLDLVAGGTATTNCTQWSGSRCCC